MKDLSHLIQGVPPSATVAVSDKARTLRAQGRDVIALAGGDPDFPTPSHIVDAAVKAMRQGDTHYSPARGKSELLRAIAHKLQRENQVSVNPETQIIVTPGGKWALYLALASVTNPGDEILYFEPAWVSYAPMITLTGGVPVPIPLDGAHNFLVTEEALRERISSHSKLLLVNSPNNPTGRVLEQAEIDAIMRVATEHDLYVISDEIYEHLVFDGRLHRALAAQPGMAERTITVNGFSKGYAMTGWRVGWLAGPEAVVRVALRLHSHSITAVSSFVMAGAVAALEGPQECISEMRDAYAARRDFMVHALNSIDGIECPSPEGAFYLFLRFPNSRRTSLELADLLLERAEIAATPGIAFGSSGEGHVRFSIATAMTDLERAVERLQAVAPLL